MDPVSLDNPEVEPTFSVWNVASVTVTTREVL
jgi:hypothetical protein